MDLVLATQNKGKLKELKALASAMPDLNLILAPPDFDPEETGSTFIENAVIKAREAARMTGVLSVADDSGICVDALDGRPGIHSARYCLGSDGDRRIKLLAEMAAVPVGKRQAAFVCAMALVSAQDELLFTCEARWPGELALAERGTHGFGFDPIFCPLGQAGTAAELEPHLKNEISHRGQAWRQVLNFLSAGAARA
ncbi:MAG: RdgB/HAM1 family non-canonical purine NTP pyrophosphatase [Cyanobacteria bacterium SZAS TMP-1]|nr:RdgB/HAM1 family non-canonical purine NTP pyrophosphatase [Cyanobacteria bacterium SZAS TMP-1]